MSSKRKVDEIIDIITEMILKHLSEQKKEKVLQYSGDDNAN